VQFGSFFFLFAKDVMQACRNSCAVVHLTSVRRLGGPYESEVQIPRGVARIPKASVVKCSEIYTLLKDHLGELIVGKLRASTLPRSTRRLPSRLASPPG